MLFKIFACCVLSLFSFFSVQAQPPKPTSSSEVEVKINAGNRLAKAGEYAKAEAELSAAIAKDSENARAYKLRGHVYYAQGDYRLAFSDLDRVVKLVPDHPNALIDRAIVHSMLGHHGLALADVERALALKPDSHFAQAVRKKILEMAED